MIKKLPSYKLREICDKETFSFKTTEELSPLEDIIGQERAVRAMEFGLRIDRKGYNIFMTGLTGTGKTSYARSVVRRIAESHPAPEDILYVYNFTKPEKPKTIFLPAGKGSEFCTDMEELLQQIHEDIMRIFRRRQFPCM